jgi:LmbE family N-acetylglucosaminyl deacetylase
MARHIGAGDRVSVVIFAEGFTSRQPRRNRRSAGKELNNLQKSGLAANRLLGVSDVQFHDLPDNRMDSIDRLDVVKLVESHIKRVDPDIIYTHSATDVNIDHRVLHDAVIVATRPMPKKQIAQLLFFEVPSSTEWQVPGVCPFVPNWFVDISRTIESKVAALRAYESEMRPWPHPRSIRNVENLASVRGATIGVGAAEAFVLGRLIQTAETNHS